MRLRSLVVAVVALSLLAGGCARRDSDEKKLIGWIDRTADLSNRFVYTESYGGQNIIVRGIVEDDFRYKARVTLNSADILDQVVSDDALAVRFLDPSVLPRFVKAGDDASSALQPLSERRWVVDPAGAPPAGLPVTDERYAGVDPVVDSLAVLAYAKLAVTQADGVRRFNRESIDYRPAEDPFPAPEDDSGIERYDIVPRAFPKPDTVARTGNERAAFADVSNFRKLAIYVKDGRVLQVRERIAAEGKILEKFEDYMKAFAKQGGDTAEKQLDEILTKFDGERRVSLLVQSLNAGLRRAGRQPVTFRTMTYELRDLGADVEVGLPSSAVEAELAFFGVNAVDPQDTTADEKGAAPEGASSPTSTAPGATDSTSNSTVLTPAEPAPGTTPSP